MSVAREQWDNKKREERIATHSHHFNHVHIDLNGPKFLPMDSHFSVEAPISEENKNRLNRLFGSFTASTNQNATVAALYLGAPDKKEDKYVGYCSDTYQENQTYCRTREQFATAVYSQQIPATKTVREIHERLLDEVDELIEEVIPDNLTENVKTVSVDMKTRLVTIEV